MGFYLRTGVGPLRYSTRLGGKSSSGNSGCVTVFGFLMGATLLIGWPLVFLPHHAWWRWAVAGVWWFLLALLTIGVLVGGAQEKQERAQKEREAAAARAAAEADHDARTYRATIAQCRIDGVKGGSFEIVAEGRPTVGITVQPDLALQFLSLRNGDIVEVTLTKDGAVEEFLHLSRANGAKPRSPVPSFHSSG
jgi:hypothetical protein